jgi:hypothetical protein
MAGSSQTKRTEFPANINESAASFKRIPQYSTGFFILRREKTTMKLRTSKRLCQACQRIERENGSNYQP